MKTDPSARARLFALIFLAAMAGVALLEPIAGMRLLVSQSYVDGWMADHAARVQRGGLLYDPSLPLNPYNYPPLYPLLLSRIGSPGGDLILLGRQIALAATGLAGAAVFGLSRALSLHPLEAGCAALLFLAVTAGLFPGYVAVNDPTMLGYAASTAGLALFAAHWRRPGALLGAALLVCLAGLLKHHLVAAPLAISLFLALEDRRALVRWLGIAGAVLAGALALLAWAYGGAPFEALMGPRRMGFGRLVALLPRRLAPLSPAIAIAVVQLVRSRGSQAGRLLGCYAAASLCCAGLFTLGDGVHHNVFYDLLIVLCIALGASVQSASIRAATAPSRANVLLVWALPLVAALPLLGQTPLRLAQAAGAAERGRAAERETKLDLAYLRHALAQHANPEAPLLCETPALCYWSQQPVEVDLFNARQAFLIGTADERQLIEAVEARRFAAVHVSGLQSGDWHDRISPALLEAIGRNYRILRKSHNGYFLQPAPILPARRAPPAEADPSP